MNIKAPFIFFASLIFMCLSTKSYSRLGETKNECIKRYGDADIDEDNELYLFYKGGYRIAILFSNDRAISINFKKETDNIFGERMSDNEIEILLNKNSGGRSWIKRVKKNSMSIFFYTKDQKFMATYNLLEETMSIISGDHLEAIVEADKASEKEKLEDF